MVWKYNPEDYDEVLAEYMTKAYRAYEAGNNSLYECICTLISAELKTAWKSGMLTQSQANEMDDYFWRYVAC